MRYILLSVALLPLFFATAYAEEYGITELNSSTVSTTGSYNSLVHLDNGITVLAYNDSNSDRGYLKTFQVEDDGTFTQLGLTYHDQTGSHYTSLTAVDSDTVILAYSDIPYTGILKTFNITSAGRISQQDAFHFDTVSGTMNSLIKLESDVFVLIYDGGSAGNFMKTFNVSDIGQISLLETLALPDLIGGAFFNDVVEVNSGLIAVSYVGHPFDLRTYNIATDGSITQLGVIDHEIDKIWNGSLVKVDDDTIALSFNQSTTNEGIVKTFDIAVNGAITLNQSLIYGDKYGNNSDLINLGNDIFVLANTKSNLGAVLFVFKITNDGTITDFGNKILEFERSSYTKAVAITSDIIAMSYTQKDKGNVFKTFKIQEMTDTEQISNQLELISTQLVSLTNLVSQNIADITNLQTQIDNLPTPGNEEPPVEPITYYITDGTSNLFMCTPVEPSDQ